MRRMLTALVILSAGLLSGCTLDKNATPQQQQQVQSINLVAAVGARVGYHVVLNKINDWHIRHPDKKAEYAEMVAAASLVEPSLDRLDKLAADPTASKEAFDGLLQETTLKVAKLITLYDTARIDAP